ncbi:MAG TPA: tetratricopeptide repeat protein [Phycisphaerae bacterium]|nr:tetratricopeptide repeat protein [Phycisphaerae bacterium]HNU45712.1 tetratricopeptide repeat protein [Phycisphaerae bacterium]
MLLAIGGVALSVTLVHWPVLSARALSFDDQPFLVDNPAVRQPSWRSVGQFFGEVLEPSTVQGYYLPLTMTSLMVDYALGGRPDDLRPFHRTNLTLHVLCTVSLLMLLYLLFGQVWPAAFVAVLFGLHPLTVEPVAWVGERKTLLATLFALWSLVLYVRYAQRGSRLGYGGCLAAFVLALLSKPTSTPLPLLLVLLDYWPLRRLSRATLLRTIPFFAVAGLSAVVTLISHARTACVEVPIESGAARLPLLVAYLLSFYAGKIIWPVHLTSVYPIPAALPVTDLLLVIGVVVVLLLSWCRTRAGVVSAACFVAALAPTLGLVRYSWVLASDKYVYLPAVGVCLLLCSLLTHVWSGARAQARTSAYRAVVVAAVIIVGFLAARATRMYLSKWQDTETLYRHMLTHAPASPYVHNNLASLLSDARRYEEALRHARRALELKPGYASAYCNLGIILRELGQPAEALPYLRRALALEPDFALARAQLGLTLLKLERAEEAVEELRAALRITGDRADMWYGLGCALLRQRSPAAAAEAFATAARLDPKLAEARVNLALVLREQGDEEGALRELRAAVLANPNLFEAHYNLGVIHSRRGEVDEAVAALQTALHIRQEQAALELLRGLQERQRRRAGTGAPASPDVQP